MEVEAEPFLQPSHEKHSKKPYTLPSLPWYCVVTFLICWAVVNTVVVASLAVMYYKLPDKVQVPTSSTFSPLGSITQTFEMHAEYVANTKESDELWAALTPKGKGFVSVQKLKEVDASSFWDQSTYHGNDRVCVSVFHQLHCLNMIRTSLSMLLSPNKQTSHSNMDHHLREDHLFHCVDYLRQAITCAADTTLEAEKAFPDFDNRLGVDGWGDKHRCRNFSAVFEFIERIGWVDHTAPQHEDTDT